MVSTSPSMGGYTGCRTPQVAGPLTSSPYAPWAFGRQAQPHTWCSCTGPGCWEWEAPPACFLAQWKPLALSSTWCRMCRSTVQYITCGSSRWLSSRRLHLNPLTPAKKKVSEFADFFICYWLGLKKRLSKYENFDFKLFVQKIGALIF